MKTTRMLTILALVLYCLDLVQGAPVGTEFTYQGRLIDANRPAEGQYDFIFRIYDVESDGTQAGEDVNVPDVDVIDGYFTVELDFGNVFTGEARWLEIGVRTGDSNDVFTVLSPRQKITALPYALYATSGISSTGSTETDIVTGSIPYNNNPPYNTIIGLVKDVSSEIPSGFTLVDVTAKGRKADEMTGELLDEPPLILYPKVNGTNIEIRVWDEAGNEEYGAGAGWNGKKAHIEYTLFMKKSGASGNKRVVAGQFTGLPPNLDNITMPSTLTGANATNTFVVASGFKIDNGETTPLAVRGTVQSPSLINFEVWDIDGNMYSPAAWEEIEINYCVVDR